ncbi:MAG: MATE family efflux transporter [Oscillospiraceae bacterium]|nr:MATE family efflux transporter [Oscillospiraceae bacterium]
MKLIGNKKFYGMAMRIAIPIIIQNGITNLVGMLDNIMIGQTGTEQMTGVAIVNQLMFVFNIFIFGIISGAGIFGAQYYGKGDHEGVRNTFRFKIISCFIIMTAGIILFLKCGSGLISIYLHDGGSAGDTYAALGYGLTYIKIMVIGMIPFTVSQIYSSTLRETGETVMPMTAGVCAVVVNTVLNYILIFGKFGAPRLGVSGAAIATVISRFSECALIIVWTHIKREKYQFIRGVYKTLKIPASLAKQIIIKGSPLMVNEALWSMGMAVMMQCYSIRGMDIVAAMNISTTVSNVFNVIFIAMGSAIAIIIGQLLGAGKMEQARDDAAKLIFFSVVCSAVAGAVMLILSPLFPKIYNTTDDVRALAVKFITVAAIFMPAYSFTNASYFTLRSGGKTIITFLFDSMFVWVVSIPLAMCLARLTSLNIVLIYFICQSAEIIKCVIGFILVKKGIWITNITVNNA